MTKLIPLLCLSSLAIWCGDADASHHAMLKSSYTSGRNRICVYDDLGHEFVDTVPITQLCPRWVEVE